MQMFIYSSRAQDFWVHRENEVPHCLVHQLDNVLLLPPLPLQITIIHCIGRVRHAQPTYANIIMRQNRLVLVPFLMSLAEGNFPKFFLFLSSLHMCVRVSIGFFLVGHMCVRIISLFVFLFTFGKSFGSMHTRSGDNSKEEKKRKKKNKPTHQKRNEWQRRTFYRLMNSCGDCYTFCLNCNKI